MNTEAFVAVIGSVVLAVLVRVSNMVCAWLSRVLGVQPPDPIVPPDELLLDDELADRIAVALLASSATSNDEPLPEPLPNATTGRYPEGVPARL